MVDGIQSWLGRRCSVLRRFDTAADGEEYVYLTKTEPSDWTLLACHRCAGVHAVRRASIFVKGSESTLRMRFRERRDPDHATARQVAAATRDYAIANSMTVSEAAPLVDALLNGKGKADAGRVLDQLARSAGGALRAQAKQARRLRSSQLQNRARPN